MTAPHRHLFRVFALLFTGASLVLSMTIAGSSAAAGPAQAAQQTDEEFARAAHALTERICSECHAIDEVVALRKSARDWNNTVTSMATKGASATDQEFATIKRYLTRYYGLVAVNTATADDLSAVLGLSANDAAAVVEYRKTNGKFANIEALLNVPGIDRAKIEAQPEALRFD